MSEAKRLSKYDCTAIAQVLAMGEGRISLHNIGAFSLRTGKRIVSLGKDVLSKEGRAFVAKHCRPYTLGELHRTVARKSRNIERLTRLIRVAAEQGKFKSVERLAQLARNEQEKLKDTREKLARNKTCYYTLSGKARTAYRVHVIGKRLLASA